MLHIAGMPPVYDRWLNGVVPTWASLKADRIDALRGMPAWEDGAIHLTFDLTDDETALFDRFVQFDPELAGIGRATLH